MFFVCLLFSRCSISENNPPIVRLMDLLKSDNIMQHPFKYLKDHNSKSGVSDPYLDFLKEYQVSRIDMDQLGENNPFLIKKTIRIMNLSLPVLVAPPSSHFCFTQRINQNSVLDFGFGFHKSKNTRQKNVIVFKIMLETENSKISLFSRRLHPRRRFYIQREQISLFPWINQSIKLHFITEIEKSVDGSILKSLSIPVWENPMITELSRQPKSNIILISLDTVRPDHMSCYGYGRSTTPHIDKIAGDGITFLNTYSTTSWTLPAHTSLLSGQTCNNHKIYLPQQKISPKTRMLAEILKKQYYTAAFTGGGYLSPQYGFNRGFDQYYSIRVKTKKIRLNEVDIIARRVCKWLKFNQNKSFFLFLHTYQPHDPYANSSPFGRTYLTKTSKWDKVKLASLWKGKDRFSSPFNKNERQNILDLYDGELKYTDTMFIGKIIDTLKKNKLYHNSMIIVVSDHGEEFYDHKAWLHDHSLYDESIKIPLIIKFPRNQYSGKKIHNMVRITDIMPTILEEAKVKMLHLDMNGQSLLPQILGKENKNRIFITDLALRIGNSAQPDIIAISSNQFKLILNKKIKSPYIKKASLTYRRLQIELYDLKNDPKETKNLALDSRYTKLCNQMIREIKLYEKNLIKNSTIKNKVRMNDQILNQLKSLGYIN